MKRSIILTILFLIPLFVIGQQVDYDRVISTIENRPENFADYLVQLAWENNPQPKIFENNKEIAKHVIKLAKWEWSDNMSGQFNINEISLSNIIYDYEDPLFVAIPVWNVSATIKLGDFINRPKKIQIAKEKLKIVENNTNLLKLKIRALVLEAYQDYLLSIEILKIRTEAEAEASQSYQLMSELFQDNKVDFEEFNKASLAYINSREATLQASTDISLAKYRIEELIGIKFEDAERFGRIYKK